MPDEKWAVLMEHLIPVGWAPVDAIESDMICVESELLAAGIDVVFDPRRPGEDFFSRSTAVPLKLMVKESDLERAREIVRDTVGSDG